MIDREWRRNDKPSNDKKEDKLNRDHSDSSILPALIHKATPSSTSKRWQYIVILLMLGAIVSGLVFWGVYEFYLKPDPIEEQTEENPNDETEVDSVNNISLDDFPLAKKNLYNFFNSHSNQSKNSFSEAISTNVYHYNENEFSTKDQLLRQIYAYWRKVRSEVHSNIEIQEVQNIDNSTVDRLAVKLSSQYRVVDNSGNTKELMLLSTIKFDNYGKITFYDSKR